MGGLSFTHMVLIVIVVLIFFGPTRLPGLGKSLGEAIRGFKKGIGGEEEIDVTPPEKLKDGTSENTVRTEKTSEKDKV
ncbi:MAG: twin-arginine translocase TatA/TatE family subunit [Bdellovibrionales bacterium]